MIHEKDIRKETLRRVAQQMMLAAITAPKAKGVNNIVAGMAEGEDILAISKKLKEMAQQKDSLPYILRDSDNILCSDVIVLIGARISPMELTHCGLCGFENCGEKRKHPKTPCVFNTVDLGIAVGSAVSVAADMRADNRIMNSVGMAARDLKLLGEDIAIAYGIPLSCSSKSPFFDRLPK